MANKDKPAAKISQTTVAIDYETSISDLIEALQKVKYMFPNAVIVQSNELIFEVNHD